MTRPEIILLIAKRMYHFEHPRLAWLLHPNYAQLQVQERYINFVTVLMNQLEDSDLATFHGVLTDA